MQGFSATAQQSQSTDILHITFIYAIFPSNILWTAEAASAIDSKNLSCSDKLSHNFVWSVSAPAEWIYVLPADEPHPIDSCFKAPPYPPIGCPLKWERTRRES